MQHWLISFLLVDFECVLVSFIMPICTADLVLLVILFLQYFLQERKSPLYLNKYSVNPLSWFPKDYQFIQPSFCCDGQSCIAGCIDKTKRAVCVSVCTIYGRKCTKRQNKVTRIGIKFYLIHIETNSGLQYKRK